jgi:hypothetical protein
VELRELPKLALSEVTYEIIFTLRVSVTATTLPLFLTGKYEKNVWKTPDDYTRKFNKKERRIVIKVK